MKKSLIIFGLLSLGMAHAQQGNVGINIDAPKGTLDIQPDMENAKESATTNQGIIAPRLSKTRIANIADESLVEGTLVYATNDTYSGANAKVSKITENGYYFYNGTEWVKSKTLEYSGSTSVVLDGTNIQRAELTGDVSAAQNSNNVTINDGAVTSAKIADGTILAKDLNSMGANNFDQLEFNGKKWAPTPSYSELIICDPKKISSWITDGGKAVCEPGKPYLTVTPTNVKYLGRAKTSTIMNSLADENVDFYARDIDPKLVHDYELGVLSYNATLNCVRLVDIAGHKDSIEIKNWNGRARADENDGWYTGRLMCTSSSDANGRKKGLDMFLVVMTWVKKVAEAE